MGRKFSIWEKILWIWENIRDWIKIETGAIIFELGENVSPYGRFLSFFPSVVDRPYAYKTEFVKFLTLYCEDAGLQTRQSPRIVSIMHRGWSK